MDPRKSFIKKSFHEFKPLSNEEIEAFNAFSFFELPVTPHSSQTSSSSMSNQQLLNQKLEDDLGCYFPEIIPPTKPEEFDAYKKPPNHPLINKPEEPHPVINKPKEPPIRPVINKPYDFFSVMRMEAEQTKQQLIYHYERVNEEQEKRPYLKGFLTTSST